MESSYARDPRRYDQARSERPGVIAYPVSLFDILAIANTNLVRSVQVQISTQSEKQEFVERIVDEALPGGRGWGAWRAFLHAHAALLRRLATDLVQETGLTLGDFDVLIQLADAGGELRMTDLAARAFSSRSNMTRRIERLVEEGLVDRQVDPADARSVVVILTERGRNRFAETAPVHLSGVAELFAAKLSDDELVLLERVLKKVCPDASFG
jgi:DNA-binding MarR family transcriptional regulator